MVSRNVVENRPSPSYSGSEACPIFNSITLGGCYFTLTIESFYTPIYSSISLSINLVQHPFRLFLGVYEQVPRDM